MSQPMTIEYMPIEYPESDGAPMGETDWHVLELATLLLVLKQRYRDAADVYVAGNNFVYYEKGNPRAVFSPDVYVVKGVPNKRRRIFKLWEEGRAPCFVLELTSRKTWLEDVGNKKALYAFLGVEEYFLCDPECDALDPPLQGFRLVSRSYQPIEPSPDGSVESAVLGIRLRLDDAELQAFDAKTGEQLLRPEQMAAEHDATARKLDEAEARLRQAEIDLAELRRKAREPRKR